MRTTLRLFLAIACLPSAAAATTAANLPCGSADPCRINSAVPVTPGSVLDLGSRQLIVEAGGSLDVGSGAMTVGAGSVTVLGGGALRAGGGVTRTGGTITLVTDRTMLAGEVDVSGAPGGKFDLMATGDVTIGGTLNANSRRAEEDGGSVAIAGADVVLGGTLTARGSREATGGDLNVVARGNLTITGVVSVSGPDGGAITFDVGSGAAGNLTVTSTGQIDADSTSADGTGDAIDISVSGDGQTTGHFILDGRISISAPNGGSAGVVDATASGAIRGGAGSRLTATARFGGDGGDIDLTTEVGGMDLAATIETAGSGSGSRAGDLALDAAGTIQIRAAIDARGGRDGGDVDIFSGADVEVRSTIRSEGAAPGRAGSILIEGCLVTIARQATVSSLGPNGLNRLTGRTRTVVDGTLRADGTSGRNEIVFGEEPPLLGQGASVTPAQVQVENPALPLCGPPRTATPTRPPTATPTATRTPSGAACIGDCNGSGWVTVDELVVGISIALGQLPLNQCPAFDGNSVDVQELVAAVQNAIDGCP